MPACPGCGTELKTIRHREGLFFDCPACSGRAVTLPQIRRVAGDRFATRLLRQINGNPNLGRRRCPFCTRPMRLFASQQPPLELDACKTCGVVWFDPTEFATVPEGFVESPDAARLRGLEADATWRNGIRAERSGIEQGPDEDWKTIPALFGLPVESEGAALSRHPCLTWTLALVIATVSLSTLRDLKAAVSAYGFIPAEAWRDGGVTFLTSFFLHGGVMHLLVNLYFLLIFGDNVEDHLGRPRFAWLLLGATLAGDVVHLLADPASPVPAVGASGGISGVIVFYALQFPHARLGFLYGTYAHFRWWQMPAWFALVLWLILQSFTLADQLNGQSRVAATAHLGGAAAGLLFWLGWRRR